MALSVQDFGFDRDGLLLPNFTYTICLPGNPTKPTSALMIKADSRRAENLLRPAHPSPGLVQARVLAVGVEVRVEEAGPDLAPLRHILCELP